MPGPRAALRLIATLCALAVLLAAPSARAATLLRDADLEHALAQISAPVLRAAGLSPAQVDVLVIKDDRLNAFVADTTRIFVHSGLIMKLPDAKSLQAVIAHEAAHITGGHLSRRMANMRAARNAAGLGMVLAAAAGAATGSGEAAAGIMLGTQGSALRNFLSHTRAEESSADIASIRTLVQAGIDPSGALTVQELFLGQEALNVGRQDPYMRSHPLTRDRFRTTQGLVAAAKVAEHNDPAADYWFLRARGKLSAFLRAPGWTLGRLDDSGSRDIALMREAVARHRQSDLPGALRAIDGAIALRPKDPFYYDLKGQILLEGRRPADSARVYAQARAFAPRNAQILGGLGRAQLASGQFKSALSTLEEARGRDWADPRILRDLSVAYARANNNGMASEATAQRYALEGRMEDAGIHAKRAVDLLPRGSAPWNRAQDVLDASERAARKR
ncbi:M48 family metalloprotease [Alloyangia pacifica]|uniref:Putative Zn-dependent protease, contains TPR repeats n=1 Tax=Alloyangia pacifica TaxID=311180 RepID=A0A1I6VQI5_9RHOB|nr:M48 family metalloprotease [Alloyangia pacifica]SDI09201.1 Putative Zn-dependent protease, contains TPR repeats [Alloyangia pacifica]SFT15841.1 Putative Zn-dependent protease, contains TPR repeats [Alloyangia pacifica]